MNSSGWQGETAQCERRRLQREWTFAARWRGWGGVGLTTSFRWRGWGGVGLTTLSMEGAAADTAMQRPNDLW